MLVLNRRLGEQIVIGANIVVTVVAVQGNRVKLGFDAPAEVAVVRGELPRRVKRSVTLEDASLPLVSPFPVEA